jgi:hypothetical protein
MRLAGSGNILQALHYYWLILLVYPANQRHRVYLWYVPCKWLVNTIVTISSLSQLPSSSFPFTFCCYHHLNNYDPSVQIRFIAALPVISSSKLSLLSVLSWVEKLTPELLPALIRSWSSAPWASISGVSTSTDCANSLTRVFIARTDL